MTIGGWDSHSPIVIANDSANGSPRGSAAARIRRILPPVCGNALYRSLCGGHGGHIAHLVLDGCFPDIGVIRDAALADGCVDDQLDFAVHDGVHNVGPPLINLQNPLARNAVACKILLRSFCCDQSESEIGKLPGNLQSFGFVGVRNG